MPTFEALFYPNYQPSALWLKRYLLAFDAVHAIIPKAAERDLDDFIFRLREKIPDAFIPESPSDLDLKYLDLKSQTLHRAFQLIKKRENIERKRLNLPPNRMRIVRAQTDLRNGKLIFRHKPEKLEMFIHEKKMTQNIHYLLSEYELIHPSNEYYTKGFSRKDYHVVNKEAGSLIISLIADSMARRMGIQTITENILDFSVNSLNAMSSSSSRNILAGAILELEVPSKINKVSLDQYMIIRNAYADVRQAFHQVIAELAMLHQLEQTNDTKVLADKINAIANEFHREVEKFKKSRFVRQNILSWEKLPLASLLTLATNMESDIKIAVACLSISIEIVQNIYTNRFTENPHDQVHRFLSNLPGDITYGIRRQALEGWGKSSSTFKEYIELLK